MTSCHRQQKPPGSWQWQIFKYPLVTATPLIVGTLPSPHSWTAFCFFFPLPLTRRLRTQLIKNLSGQWNKQQFDLIWEPKSFCCSGADSGVSARAGRNVPTKPTGLEKLRCRRFFFPWFCRGFISVLVSVWWFFKGVERAGRQTSQQCTLEHQEAGWYCEIHRE